MHSHDISDLLNFQDVTIVSSNLNDQTKVFTIELEPCEIKQCCLYCGSNKVNSNGRRPHRRLVRHLNCFNYKTFLSLPIQRLKCTDCEGCFTFSYSFVDEGSHFTNQFKEVVAESLFGTTLKVVAKNFDLAYSTCERIVKEWLIALSKIMQDELIKQAANSEGLVLGIDDFAIRKGHNYNTGVHDIRNQAILFVEEGRRFDELVNNSEFVKQLKQLNPVAVVMDLARSYHKFSRKLFPNALRIADRFHVNRYMTNALQAVRKRVAKALPKDQASDLKKYHKLLGQRFDSLTEKQQKALEKRLSYSDELHQTYLLKEALIDWYDLSFGYNSLPRLKNWIKQGESLEIPEVTHCLKTFKNWTMEISNYHTHRYSNASVEGRNNKIKTLMRMCYFLRNRLVYESRIFCECNLPYWKI